jgi:Tfp pilus assembly protein PilO
MNTTYISKIKECISKVRQDLGVSKTLSILYGSLVFLVVLILIFVHRPLVIELQGKDKEFRSLESRLLNQRNIAAMFKTIDLERKLMRQKEISLAIDEITEKGRALGIKFVSIAPQKLQELEQVDVKRLPIDFKIESEYKNLGQFLTYLEEFRRSIVEVENLSIQKQKKVLPQLEVEMLVHLYIGKLRGL